MLTVLAPETVQHRLGEGVLTWIFLDLVGIELDLFLDLVVVDVLLSFVGIVAHPVGPSTGFLFHFEEGEQIIGPKGELPDFGHALNDVTLIDGFLQFGAGPGTHETAFVVRVAAMMNAFGLRFGLFVFYVGSTERKREFASAALGVRRDGTVRRVVESCI